MTTPVIHGLGRKPSPPDPRDWRLGAFLDHPHVDEQTRAVEAEWSAQGLAAHSQLRAADDLGPLHALLAKVEDQHHTAAFKALMAAIVDTIEPGGAPTPPTPPVPPAPDPTPTPQPAPTPTPAPDPGPAAMVWGDAEILDQGQTPECTAFSAANFCNILGSENVDDRFTATDASAMYGEEKAIDGDNEPGSTIRTQAKMLVNRGRIKAYAFGENIAQVRTWTLTKGPMTIGIAWRASMFQPDEYGVVSVSGAVAGGHALAIRGGGKLVALCLLLGIAVPPGLDPNAVYYLVRNSWGSYAPLGADFLIAETDLNQVLFGDGEGGEALAAVELPLAS